MSTPDGPSKITRRLRSRVKTAVEDRIPNGWQSRLGMLRGIFVQDTTRQLGRLTTVLRHLKDYRRIDRALFYHRYAASLLLAYHLGLFEALDGGPREPDTIARRLRIRPEAARNLLQILLSQNLVRCTEGRYELTEFAAEFFNPDSDVSLVPMLEVAETYARAYPHFFDAAESGAAPGLLDVFDEEGRVDALLTGVNSYLDQAGRELIARVDWPDIRHFIVGSMGVSFSSLLLSEFPHARVTYGCLPHLVERIPHLRRRYDVPPDRVVDMHAHGGEPDEDRWGREAFDLVFLTKKMILDPENHLGEKFARKAHHVLQPGGVALFWETIHASHDTTCPDRGMETFLDFGVSPTAPVLTEDGFRRDLQNIGFSDIDVVPVLDGTTTFAVARKN